MTLSSKQIAQRRKAGEARRRQVIEQVGAENVSDYYSGLGKTGGRPTWEQTLARIEAERKSRARYRPRRKD